MKKSLKSALIGIAFVAGIGVTPASADQIINLYSGNGTVGGADSQINFLQGPLDTGFGTVFTPADFTAASGGAAATVINNHPAWITAASFNANAATAAVPAQWISNSAIGGASFGDKGLRRCTQLNSRLRIRSSLQPASISISRSTIFWGPRPRASA